MGYAEGWCAMSWRVRALDVDPHRAQPRLGWGVLSGWSAGRREVMILKNLKKYFTFEVMVRRWAREWASLGPLCASARPARLDAL